MKQIAAQSFTRTLLSWHHEQNTRQMPWKGEKDPYKIWLSEIILQQTRVEQGWAYYNRFIKTFPTIHKLAAAPEEKVMKLWEGLGYYSRCRNLMATARYISKDLKGVFPTTYEDIQKLKGIGPYTAAAISSFAFNLPHAVVDGNVYRVLARVFGIDTPTDSTGGKKIFTQLAGELLDKQQPGIYNQAIMDFGAVVCKPAAPLCAECVFKKACNAFSKNRVTVLPVKEKKLKLKNRWLYYLVLQYKGKWYIRLRTGKDIWQGLYEFTLLETPHPRSASMVLKAAEKNGLLKPGQYTQNGEAITLKQTLSHQQIEASFILIQCKEVPVLPDDYVAIPKAAISRYAFPKIINEWIRQA